MGQLCGEREIAVFQYQQADISQGVNNYLEQTKRGSKICSRSRARSGANWVSCSTAWSAVTSVGRHTSELADVVKLNKC